MPSVERIIFDPRPAPAPSNVVSLADKARSKRVAAILERLPEAPEAKTSALPSPPKRPELKVVKMPNPEKQTSVYSPFRKALIVIAGVATVATLAHGPNKTAEEVGDVMGAAVGFASRVVDSLPLDSPSPMEMQEPLTYETPEGTVYVQYDEEGN